MIDALEGLKQIAEGEGIDIDSRVRLRARQLARMLLSVTLDRWAPDRKPVAWTNTKSDGFVANDGRWEFTMRPVATASDVNWRWVARRIEASGTGTRLVRIEDGEAHSALAAELYMVMLVDLGTKHKKPLPEVAR